MPEDGVLQDRHDNVFSLPSNYFYGGLQNFELERTQNAQHLICFSNGSLANENTDYAQAMEAQLAW